MRTKGEIEGSLLCATLSVRLMEQVTDAGYVQVQNELPEINLPARDYLENRS